jgi:hypothetical protein
MRREFNIPGDGLIARGQSPGRMSVSPRIEVLSSKGVDMAQIRIYFSLTNLAGRFIPFKGGIYIKQKADPEV